MALLSSLTRLVTGLGRTRDELRERLGAVFRPGRALDPALFDELEEALVVSDVGAPLAASLIESVRRSAREEGVSGADGVPDLLRRELRARLEAAPQVAMPGTAAVPGASGAAKPRVVLVVGVNGGGKTTTVGKLAARAAAAGQSVVLAAADTFRAAAIEQLEIWAGRAGVPLVRQGPGADPSAVVFDALQVARARGADLLIVDTAGRLHTRSNLMQELEKIVRITGREIPGAPHETLLVLDATTGQNGLAQAREFLKTARVTGLVLTKLDGTARGGVALAIAVELGIPIVWVGVGETVDDLVPFDAGAYVDGLLGPAREAGAAAP